MVYELIILIFVILYYLFLLVMEICYCKIRFIGGCISIIVYFYNKNIDYLLNWLIIVFIKSFCKECI